MCALALVHCLCHMSFCSVWRCPYGCRRLRVCNIRVVVIFEVRNFLAPNPGICKVPGGNPLDKIIYESVKIYPVLNDLEVSRNVI